MLVAWMKTNSTTAWAKGLWDVQFSKNRALHHGIRRSPYEAMFGEQPRVGLSSSFLPNDLLETLETEEDLEKALNEFSVRSHQCVQNGTAENDKNVSESSENGNFVMVKKRKHQLLRRCR